MAYVPAADAVETVNIVTNSFDAEQGMAGGAAVSVSIKSGTNQFHGSGQWFHTNSALRARNYFFVGPEIPKNIMNQFGGTFGGPVRQNKLFFFGNWERTTRRQSASAFRTIPSDALRNGDFSGTGALIYDPATGSPDGTGRQLFPNNRIPAERIDPAARQMIQLIPAPNVAAFPNNYFATGTYEFDRDNLDFKVNYNPGAQASVFARYSFSPSDLFESAVARGGGRRRAGRRAAGPGAGPHPERRGRRHVHDSRSTCSSMRTSASRGSGSARRTSTSTRTTVSTCSASPAPTARTGCRAAIRASSSTGSRRSGIPTCPIPSSSATTSTSRSAT